jgi:thioredoxin 1
LGGKVGTVSDQDFEALVLKADRPVLVDFWAAWCAPCRMVAPLVHDLAAEMGDRVRVLKMDIDANPETAGRLGVLSIPTLIIFKDGRPADRRVGYCNDLKVSLRERLEALLT